MIVLAHAVVLFVLGVIMLEVGVSEFFGHLLVSVLLCGVATVAAVSFFAVIAFWCAP